MDEALAIVGTLTLLSALAAMSLRNLVHCALCLAAALVGLAALFLQLNAQFVGFAQMLVYVGAVAILILFAILLTRSSEIQVGSLIATRLWGVGLGVALLVLGCLVITVASSPSMHRTALAISPAVQAQVGVKPLGFLLMTDYVVPLEVMGLLLTAAMIGAVIIALHDRPAIPPKDTPS